MIKNRKFKGLVVIGMMLTLFISGCAGSNPSESTEMTKNSSAKTEKKTIKWLHHYGEDSTRKWIEEVTQLYTEKTGVEFDIQAVSYDEYQTLLKAKISSDDAPDLFDLTATDLAKYVENGYVADLSDAAFWDNMINGTKDSSKSDGKNYFMPFEANASAAYYNKDVFEKAGITELPQTYTEFIAVLEKLQNSGVVPIALGAQEAWTITNDYRADMLQQVLRENPDWMKDMEARNTKFAEDTTFINTLEKFKERHEYGNAEPFGTDWNKATEMVATGEAAMVINGSWSISAIQEKNPDAKIGCFPVPGTDNPEDTKLTTWSGDGFVVYAKSEVKDEVIDFLSVLTGQESGNLWQNGAKRLSVIKDLPEADDPALGEISAYMNDGKIFDVSSMQNEFTNEYYDANIEILTKYLLGEIDTAQKAAEELDKKFDEINSRQQ